MPYDPTRHPTRKPLRGEPRTYENTPPLDWWALACTEFRKLGLVAPTFGPAHDAYEMGESPETWAAYMLHSEAQEDMR